MWSPQGVPTIGDTVTIPSGIAVWCVYSGQKCSGMTIQSGGSFRVYGDAGTKIFTVNGDLSVASGGYIDSYASAKDKAIIYCERLLLAAPVSALCDFSYIRFRGVRPMLGGLEFNNTSIESPRLQSVTPLARTYRLIEHQIDGRSSSRIYVSGAAAGRVALSGYYRSDLFTNEILDTVNDAASPLPFVSEYVVLRACRIDGKISYQNPPGSLFTRFALNLVEAI